MLAAQVTVSKIYRTSYQTPTQSLKLHVCILCTNRGIDFRELKRNRHDILRIELIARG